MNLSLGLDLQCHLMALLHRDHLSGQSDLVDLPVPDYLADRDYLEPPDYHPCRPVRDHLYLLYHLSDLVVLAVQSHLIR